MSFVRAGIRTKMHDHLDHVTGLEKRELLAHLAGDCDPFRMMAIKKGNFTLTRSTVLLSYSQSNYGCF